MRSRIVRPGEMRETFGKEVGEFPYAFVMPFHGEGWDAKVFSPAEPPSASAGTALGTPAGPDAPRRRAGDKKPVYIEIKPKSP